MNDFMFSSFFFLFFLCVCLRWGTFELVDDNMQYPLKTQQWMNEYYYDAPSFLPPLPQLYEFGAAAFAPPVLQFRSGWISGWGAARPWLGGAVPNNLWTHLGVRESVRHTGCAEGNTSKRNSAAWPTRMPTRSGSMLCPMSTWSPVRAQGNMPAENVKPNRFTGCAAFRRQNVQQSEVHRLKLVTLNPKRIPAIDSITTIQRRNHTKFPGKFLKSIVSL